MSTSTGETTTVADLKARLEAIAGHPIDATPEQIREQFIKWVFPVSAYAFTSTPTDPGPQPGHVLSRSMVVVREPTCATERLLDVSGYATTAASGNQTFLISDFLCPDDAGLLYDAPVNVVATPLSSRPFFLTLTHSLEYAPNSLKATNVQITVFAWDANGNPAADVTFYWRCRVPTPIIIP